MCEGSMGEMLNWGYSYRLMVDNDQPSFLTLNKMDHKMAINLWLGAIMSLRWHNNWSYLAIIWITYTMEKFVVLEDWKIPQNDQPLVHHHWFSSCCFVPSKFDKVVENKQRPTYHAYFYPNNFFLIKFCNKSSLLL